MNSNQSTFSFTTTIDHRGYRVLVISAKDIGRIIGMTKLEVLQGFGINNKLHWMRGYCPPAISVMDSVRMVNGRGKVAILEYWERAMKSYAPRSKQEEFYIKSVDQELMAYTMRFLADFNHESFRDEKEWIYSQEAYAKDWLRREAEPKPGSTAHFMGFMKSLGSCVRKEETGFVYVAEYANGVVKIGKSQNPKQRFKSLSTMSSAPILRTFISESSERYSAIERTSHRHFEEDRLHGEMFTVSFEDAVEFITTLSKSISRTAPTPNS